MPGKRAADMLASFKSNLDSSIGHSGSSLLSDIREGSERLANELEEYIDSTNHPCTNQRKESKPLSDEGIADLQLATARKLREVRRMIVDLWYYCWRLSCIIEMHFCYPIDFLTVFFRIRINSALATK